MVRRCVSSKCNQEILSIWKCRKWMENKQNVHFLRLHLLHFIFCAICYVYQICLLLLPKPYCLSIGKSIVDIWDVILCPLGPLISMITKYKNRLSKSVNLCKIALTVTLNELLYFLLKFYWLWINESIHTGVWIISLFKRHLLLYNF